MRSTVRVGGGRSPRALAATLMKTAIPRLKAWQWALVVVLVGPPLILVLCDIGPGRWLNAVQDKIIGGHSLKLSFLVALLLELVLIAIVAGAVRWFTGRPLVELFTNKKSHE